MIREIDGRTIRLHLIEIIVIMNHGYFVRFDKWFKSPHFLCGIKSSNLLPDIVFSNVMHDCGRFQSHCRSNFERSEMLHSSY